MSLAQQISDEVPKEWTVIQWGLGAERGQYEKSILAQNAAETKALFHTEHETEEDPIQPPILTKPGLKLCFLPNVEQVAKDAALKKSLSTIFRTPRLFWERLGIDGNGFFWGHKLSSPVSYSTMSRFLIKSVDEDPDGTIGYHWQYAAFTSYWAQLPETNETVAVVLCFDLYREADDGKARSLASNIQRKFDEQQSIRDVLACPLGVYSVLLATLLADFDAALWGFKAPVRSFEKNRLNIERYDSNDKRKTDKLGMRYVEMHELSRHIIHMSETFDVTASVIEQINRFHGRWTLPAETADLRPFRVPWISHRRRTEAEFQEDFLFYQSFFNGLKMRAEAFEERLKNEIQLAFNWVAAQDSATQEKLLRAQEKVLQSQQLLLTESRNDGKGVAKTVAYASITFLPASFITGFFGMNVSTFTGLEWSAMGWELGGVLIGIVATIVIGNVALLILRPSNKQDGSSTRDVDEDSDKTQEAKPIAAFPFGGRKGWRKSQRLTSIELGSGS